MSPRHAILGAALLVAAYLALFADNQPDTEASVAIPTVVRKGGASRGPKASDLSQPPERRTERVALLPWQAREPYRRMPEPPAERQTPFAPHDWSPAPPPVRDGPPAPPQAPPLPYAYIGKQWQAGAWEVYLAMGEETRIARVGRVLDARYRVVSINPPQLNLVYLPLKQAQSLDIGAPL